MSQLQKVSRISRAKELDAKVKSSIPALVEIHKHGYFVELGFKTFADYLKSNGKSYMSNWKMMAALEIQEALPDVKIPNVATALEIKKIALPQRRQVVSTALEQSRGTLSALAIKKAVASLPERKKEPAKSVVPLKLTKDGTGVGIPPEIQEFWNRNEEIDHLIQMVKKTRITLEKANFEKDRLFFGIDRQGIISRLKMCEEELISAKSYAVCPSCNGIFFNECQDCKKRGTLSKFWYERLPEEIKKLRED